MSNFKQNGHADIMNRHNPGTRRGLPRSTSTSDLFSFPSSTPKKSATARFSQYDLPRSASSSNLSLIPEHTPQHRLTPYQMQRSTMKESFQFPNGENFTPRKQLPKSSSSVSLDKNRYNNKHHVITSTSLPRSSSMVSVVVPQSSKQLRQHKHQHQLSHSSLQNNSQQPFRNSEQRQFPSHVNNFRPKPKTPSFTNNSKIPSHQSTLSASSLQFNRLQVHQSQFSVSSSINRPTSSSNDSNSTSVSIREMGEPSSVTSTDISDEEMVKKLVSAPENKQTPKESLVLQQITKEEPQPTLKRSNSKLGSFFRRLLPSRKKSKKLNSNPNSKPVINETKARSIPKSTKNTKNTTDHETMKNDSTYLLRIEDEDEPVDEADFKELMDIDLVFDSLLLKSEQHQQVSDSKLIKEFNKHIRISSPVVEPPPRSSQRPVLVKDANGTFNMGQISESPFMEDRILEHLHQNWKAVHINSILPPSSQSYATSSEAKKCRFNDEIYVNDTFSSTEYVRSDKVFLENRKQLLKSQYIQGIKHELNNFKRNEMTVHPKSSKNTHFFV